MERFVRFTGRIDLAKVWVVAALAVCVVVLSAQGAAAQPDPSTLTGKLVCGYQGWFTCAGDGNHPVVGWWHWTKDRSDPKPGVYNTDMWPDVAEYNAQDLFYCPNTTLGSGNPAYLFSSTKQGATNTHFRWMQENMIDGVFLQRFVNGCVGNPYDPFQAVIDTVLENVMNASSSCERVFVLEYDISGTAEWELYNRITSDWTYLKNTFNIKNHPRYLYHNGKPVVTIWGLGFEDRPGTPSIAQNIINWFKNDGCFVIGGVPWGWRTLTGGSKTDPAWASVYRSYDGLSPWTVGAYADWNGILWYKNNIWAPDVQECNNYGIRYMPTAWPRFGWDNMRGYPCGQSKISPRGGQHIWDQFYAMIGAGAHNIFVAMFDEYDESTAIMKMSDDVPTSGCWWTNEGKPKDWHLALTNYGSRMFKGQIPLSQTIPVSPSNCGDDAGIVSDTIPSAMAPGGQYDVSVTVENTGDTCWSSRDFWKLGTIDDSDPFYDGCRVYMDPGTTVMPGEQYTFYFTLTAPTSPGTYTTDWQMVHEFARWFGEALVKQVEVGQGGTTDNAQYISDTIPAQMSPGQQVQASVTMKNTGTSTWTRDDFKLGTVDDSDPFYPYGRVYLDPGETIAPGQQKTFAFTMTAPDDPGVYVTDWQMVHEFVQWFGDILWKQVNVSDSVWIDLGYSNTSDRMTHPQPGDGDTTGTSKGGRECRKNVNSSEDYYFYFAVDDSYAYQGSKPNLYITVDYYDTGGGQIALQYDASDNVYKFSDSIQLGSTNTWKSYTWHITDAYFGNRQNNGSDFRIWLETQQTRYLDTVTVSTTAP